MHFSSLTALLAAFFISGALATALNKNSMASPPVDALAARKAKKPTCDITTCDGALGTPSAVSSCVTAVAGLNKPAGKSDTSASALQCLLLANLGIITLPANCETCVQEATTL